MKNIRLNLFAFVATLALVPSAFAQQQSVADDFNYSPIGTVGWTTERYRTSPASFKSNPSADVSGWGTVKRNFKAGSDGEVSIWFYDDMGGCWNASGKTQATTIQVGNGGDSTQMVGVDTGISSCNYVRRVGYSYYVTSISRSSGWHQFRFSWSFGWLTVTIDGQVVVSQSYPYAPDNIWFGDMWSGGAVGPGWFDDLYIRVN